MQEFAAEAFEAADNFSGAEMEQSTHMVVDRDLHAQSLVFRAEMERMQVMHRAEMERALHAQSLVFRAEMERALHAQSLAHRADLQQALQAQTNAHEFELRQLRYDLFVKERNRLITSRQSCRITFGFVL